LGEAEKKYIEIVIPPYSVPVFLRGSYCYRSGSTKQKLTSASLNEFLLKKTGHTWDEVVKPSAAFDDIDEHAVQIFLKYSKKSDGFSIMKTSLFRHCLQTN
jgi:ATP-dependent DNA helicase RecG